MSAVPPPRTCAAGADTLDACSFDFDAVVFGIAVQYIRHVLVCSTVLPVPDKIIRMSNMFLHGFLYRTVIVKKIVDGNIEQCCDFRKDGHIR